MLKPSAMQGEARLRGLYRIISSKTIISVYTPPRALDAATDMNFGLHAALRARRDDRNDGD